MPRRRPVVLDRDHARPRTAPAPAGPAVEARLTELVAPAAFALGGEYRRRGLRVRVLALPVMVGVVLALVWRQVPSVGELGRVLAREGLLWVPPTRVSPQALGLRLRCLPAELFHRVLDDLRPALAARAAARARALTALSVERVLAEGPAARDRVVRLGKYRSNPCRHPVRLVEVQVGGRWRGYLTNVLDPQVLPAADVVDLYGRRWRIEEAFLLTKRLLGLSYLWSGAFNAVAVQVWATWLLYAALVDLTDAVAEELDQPLDALSLEMVYRGLYHFAVAAAAGRAADPVAYLADPANRDLGVVKRRRKHRERTRLDTAAITANL